MAQLPADRTKLAQAQGNMTPTFTASSQKLKDALTEAYDTVDMLNQKVNDHGAAATLPHADKSVTRAKLADKVVGAGQLDDAAVGQTHHQDNGIPSRALPDNVILQRHMSDNSVGSAEIQASAVTATKIPNGTINSQHIDAALLASSASLATQAEFDKRELNVQKYGAKGDGVTDDTTAIQNALDYLHQKGGGTLYFPLGRYIISSPLLMKSPDNDGGYDWAKITLKGEGNRGSLIEKVGSATLLGLDAACIMVRGSTLSLNDTFSGMGFDNIKILNSSTGTTTYGVYGKIGSRIIANYSSFATIRDLATVATHDRYAFYVQTGWAWNFRDCKFDGDYGFYNLSNSTSLILENCFASTDKIGYRIQGIYSTLTNVYGDFCNGTLFDFQFAQVTCTALGGESRNCTTILNANNSQIDIVSAYLFQPSADLGMVVKASASKLYIKTLAVDMAAGATRGYLWKDGSGSSIKVERLTLAGSGIKFKYSDAGNMWANVMTISISPDEGINYKGIVSLLPYKTKYWDWYIETPTLPVNNMFFGFQTPTIGADGANIGAVTPPAVVDGIYINSDFSARPVLGWVRYEQTGPTLGEGKNYYIPLDIVCTTATRPTWTYQGMRVYDTDLKKSIWWSGTSWTDANNVNPDSRGIGITVATSSTTFAVTFPTAEANVAYAVSVSLNWNTTYWVTAKTTTGFTINFGTAPAIASSLDWSIRR